MSERTQIPFKNRRSGNKYVLLENLGSCFELHIYRILLIRGAELVSFSGPFLLVGIAKVWKVALQRKSGIVDRVPGVRIDG